MAASTPFQLSRIYASGWSTGRKCTSDDVAEIEGMADSLNPHPAAEERERWSQGFKDAALQHLIPPAKSRQRPARTGE